VLQTEAGLAKLKGTSEEQKQKALGKRIRTSK